MVRVVYDLRLLWNKGNRRMGDSSYWNLNLLTHSPLSWLFERRKKKSQDIHKWYYIFPDLFSQKRQSHPTPVLLPRKSHGQRSLVGCSPWGHEELDNWATSLSLFTFMHWRRKWQPTPVFLPGESQGWGNLVGCRLWGCTESDTTEAT